MKALPSKPSLRPFYVLGSHNEEFDGEHDMVLGHVNAIDEKHAAEDFQNLYQYMPYLAVVPESFIVWFEDK